MLKIVVVVVVIVVWGLGGIGLVDPSYRLDDSVSMMLKLSSCPY